MKGFLKILLYIALLGLCAYCVKGFLAALQAGMDRAERQAERHYEDYDPDLTGNGRDASAGSVTDTNLTNGIATDVTPTNPPPTGSAATNDLQATTTSSAEEQPQGGRSGLGLHAAGALLSLIGLALLLANDISRFAARSAHRMLEGVEEGDDESREYEEAERLWANSDYLGAVHVLRDYLKKHPRRVHAHFRIAEIYEKDLKNTLAAALEHEEILKFRLDEERWGWAAIHLCNLYYHLDQPEKAEALLHRIVNEYGHTVASGKARKRLGIPEEGDAAPREPAPPGDSGEADSEDPEPSDRFQLPRGFRPK
jgi:TolA-binding protein